MHTRYADSWNLNDIIDKVLDIATEAENEHGRPEQNIRVRFHINITSGTHVISSAVTCAAFYIGADLYYILNRNEHPEVTAETETRRFEIPFIPDVERLKGPSRNILLILMKEEAHEMRNEALRSRLGGTEGSGKMKQSTIGYHTGVLERQGLIEKRYEGKESVISLTYPGMVAARIINSPMYDRS